MKDTGNTTYLSRIKFASKVQFNQLMALQRFELIELDSLCFYQEAWDIWRLSSGPQGGIGGTGC